MNITSIGLGAKYTEHARMMEALAQECYRLENVLASCNHQLLTQPNPMALSPIDAKVKSGGSLTFEEAFAGMLLVLAGTNNPIRHALFPEMAFTEALSKGTGFLQLMAAKEAFRGLTPEEVAGMVAAGTLDLVFRPELPMVVETCGMGGDRGWGTKTVKTISASTLSALVLATVGFTTFKHGSYGNTTTVGSTDVPINFGANIYQRHQTQILEILERTNFWYSDAHAVKTLHYLSHLLMVETVNHIIGPMTVPVARGTKLFKVIGVNHHVNPQTVAQAYVILHQRGFVNLGGVIVVCGLDQLPKGSEHQDHQWVTEHAFLDEVSPRATLVSLASGDRYIGDMVLTDEHFGAPPLLESALKVPNNIDFLMAANEGAISGSQANRGARALQNSQYLARNSALGLLVARGLDEREPLLKLPGCYERCLETINSGEVYQTLKHYAKASGGSFRSWL